MKTIRTNARLNLDKCVGCKMCTHVCPTKAYTVSLKRPAGRLKVAPCALQCPLGNDIEGFVSLAAEGRYLEAYALILANNPFPGITGRVCHHPCEEGCNRMQFDESVSINALERFVADYAMERGYKPSGPEVLREAAVAVVGAGPAGLSCAYHLGRLGYAVTVFESAVQAGGLLRYGIPEYRLPKKVLDWELDKVVAQNVEIRTGQRLGKDFKLADLKDFAAVFVAVGLSKSRPLNIPNEKSSRVYAALDLLQALSAGEKIDLGEKAAVIGGGNSAVDAARSLLRLGVRPVILYRRSVAEMPALASEKQELEREGIEVVPFVAPVRVIVKGGRIRQLECLRTRSGEANADGRRQPVAVEGSEFTIEVDNVVVAAGELPDFTGLGASLITKEGKLALEADGVTLGERIFAGGDVATGEGMVSLAMASGRKGASAIHRFLEGGGAEQAVLNREAVRFEEMNPDYFQAADRQAAGRLEPEAAVATFDEVNWGYSEEQARCEAQRCLGCAASPVYKAEDCRGCRVCADRCPVSAIAIEPLAEPFTVEVDPAQFDPEDVWRICRKAHYHPKLVVCHCNDLRAGEIAAAILKGAKTPEEVTRMTGARAGCGVACTQSVIKLLEAAGLPVEVKPGDTHQLYGKTFTMWDLDPELKARHDKRGYHFDDDMKLFAKVFEKK